MVNVLAHYEDGNYVECLHITQISYMGYDKTVIVPEEELTSHLFPINQTLWFHSADGISVLSSKGLRCVKMVKE